MRKISVFGLDFLLAGNLIGINIFDNLISKISYPVDKDGNIHDYAIDNLKVVLKVIHGMALAKDSDLTGRIRNALASLLDYGTETASDRIRQYLESPASSQSGLVAGSVPQAGAETSFAGLLKGYAAEQAAAMAPQIIESIETLVNQVRQTEDSAGQPFLPPISLN